MVEKLLVSKRRGARYKCRFFKIESNDVEKKKPKILVEYFMRLVNVIFIP